MALSLMHNIRFRRFSSVRFWHLILLLVIFGWMSVGKVDASSDNCIAPEMTNPSVRPVFPLPLTQIIVLPVAEIPNDGSVIEPCTEEITATASEQSEVATVSALVGVGKSTPLPTPKPTSTAVPKPMPTPTPKPTSSAVSTPTPVSTVKPTAAPVPAQIAAPADLESLFNQHAATHGVDPMIMKKIAQCESGMRPEATNGPYGGMFQFVASTWVSNRKAMGKDPNPALRYNAAEAIETAAFKMGRDGYGAWPACSRKALASL